MVMTEDQLLQFKTEGYAILSDVVPAADLAMIRAELDKAIAKMDAQMDEQGVDVIGINHRGKRYFVGGYHRESEPLANFVYGDLTAAICRRTLGPNAYFFLEQFVVKAADVGMKFSWHQDSGYLKFQGVPYAKPYLTMWIALDDMSIENGTISVLPYSRAGTREIIDHFREEGSNDLIGYTGDDPGEAVIISAGSMAIFQTTVLHRSGPNTTDKQRRSWVVQFSADPIVTAEGRVWNSAEPFLKDGERVR